MNKKGIPNINELINESIPERNELEKCSFNSVNSKGIQDIEKYLKKRMKTSDKELYKNPVINKIDYKNKNKEKTKKSKTDVSNDTCIIDGYNSKNRYESKQKHEEYNSKKSVYSTSPDFKEVRMQDLQIIKLLLQKE